MIPSHMIFLISLFFVFIGAELSLQKDEELVYVVHLASAGAKFPEKQISDDWKFNPGELTPVGMRQLYLLGRELRKKYVEDRKFLYEKYNPLQLKFRSVYSDSKTASASAYAFAAGLYVAGTGYTLSQFQIDNAVPPTRFVDYEPYKKALGNQALVHYYTSVPINTFTEIPNYPFEAIRLCPNIQKHLDKWLDGDGEARNKILEKTLVYEKELYPSIRKLLNLHKNITSIEEALEYRDYIISARHYAKKLNGELNDREKMLLDELYETAKYEKLLGSKKIAQIGSQGFINEFLDILKNVNATTKKLGNATAENTKNIMTSYMLNDINLLALLKLMDYKNPKGPVTVPFASSLLIEIYKSEENYILNATFNDQKIMWKGEQEKITLEEALKWVNDIELKGFNEECYGEGPLEIESFYSLIGISVGIVLLGLVGLSCFCVKKKMKREETNEETKITATENLAV